MTGEKRRELGTLVGNENDSHSRITLAAAKESAQKARLLLDST